MADFDVASGLSTVTSTAQSAFGAVASGLNTAAKLGTALSNLSSPSKLLSTIRSINLPIGGEAIGSIINAAATFVGTDANTDWRARLSIPGGTIFDSSPILKPLRDAGGLVFPYTPQITITHSAQYQDTPITHQNYQFLAYQYSRVNDIQIVGDLSVEDSVQAKYWIACIHFLRAATKMYTGATMHQGNPPPILNFSAYGDHVFRNVPVVVKSFSISLPKDVNYISTNVASGDGFGLNDISQTAGQLSGLAGIVGATGVASQLGSAAGAIGGISSTISGLGLSGIAGGQGAARDSHVPTRSELSITITPVYSREAVRQFSLQNFVNGAYVSKGFV